MRKERGAIDKQHRLNLSSTQLDVVRQALREALAADLLRHRDRSVAEDVMELIHERLPVAEATHPAGPLAGHLMLREEVLRVLLAAEDDGRYALTLAELDHRIEGKPAGVSVRATVEQLRRDKLATIAAGDDAGRRLKLTSAGRAEARRERPADVSEHAVVDAEQLLDLIYRASDGARTTRWVGEETIDLDPIWHVPIVQANAGVDRARFEALVVELRARRLVGEGNGSYLTLTQAGLDLALKRRHESRYDSGSTIPSLMNDRLMPPKRKPGELIRRRVDTACPHCGRPASWLRNRTGKKYEALRQTGCTQHICTSCDIHWTIYAEPVNRRGEYDPYGDGMVCRARWAYRSGGFDERHLAPPDHYPAYV